MEAQRPKLGGPVVAEVAMILVLELPQQGLLDKDLPVAMAHQAELKQVAAVEALVLLEVTLQQPKRVMEGLVVLRLLLERRRFTLAAAGQVLIQQLLETEAQEEPEAAVLEE
jgi:hypothetical protein